MYDFENEQMMVYDYDHKYLSSIVVVLESFNYVMSGGENGDTVLSDLTSGKTLKIINMNDLYISCFFDL